MIGNGIFQALRYDFELFLARYDLLRNWSLMQLDPRSGVVDQVKRFIGKTAVDYVAVGVKHGILKRFVSISNAVELLIAAFGLRQNLHGLSLVGLPHLHGLKASL